MKIRIISCLMAIALLLTAFAGCADNSTAEGIDTTTPVVLRVVGPWENFPGVEAVAELFSKEYPNCTVEYEYLQEYYASLEKRLASQDDAIDLFVTTNIQADTEQAKLMPYALDLYSTDKIDLSSTFDGLIRNFECRGAQENAEAELYAVPIGAEVRGMFVNVTLLKSLGISVPTNLSEFTAACAKLADNGFVPLQGNPGSFAQQLMYPYICNIIANAEDYDAVYNKINTRSADSSELLREPMKVLYNLVEANYYNYKYVETEYGLFKDTSNEGITRDFLNIVKSGDEYVKAEGIGTVAFMPSTISLESTIEKFKSDYHSEIEYKFILSPVGEDGGYAYMSPAHGIAISKASKQLEWAERFLSFMFKADISKVFAEKQSVIPNSKDAFSWISEHFSIPESHISQLGKVTFDYNFYSTVCDSLVEVAKANNPKYMKENSDGSKELYDFEYYMGNLEKRLTGEMSE